jgi:putative ABC transport system substrate-binding protein
MQFGQLKRRQFITLLGGAAAWPFAARAQQDRTRRIGVLISTTEDDPQTQREMAAFQQGLSQLGWREGDNIRIDRRFHSDDTGRMRSYAAELIALQPDVILCSGPTPGMAVQRQNGAIPIVFTKVNDPVDAGVVASLAHPGGSVTGLTPAEFSVAGKMLEVLKEVAPGMQRVGVLLDTMLTDQIGMWNAMQAGAPSIGVQVKQLSLRDLPDIEHVIANFADNRNAGLAILANRTTISHRMPIIALAAHYRLPAVYAYRFFVTDGGLVSYGADVIDIYRRAASYVDRILRGAKPADLPVMQPAKYDLAINLRTAKALGVEIPPTMLTRADEVIE